MTTLVLLLLLLFGPLIKSDRQAGMFELEVNQGQVESGQGVLPLETWSLSTKPEAEQREINSPQPNSFSNVNVACL